MEKNIWLTDKELMERCKINAPTLAQHILDNKIKVTWSETPPWMIPPVAPSDLRGLVQTGPKGWTYIEGKITKDNIPLPQYTLGSIVRFLDRAIFSLEDVLAFEAKHEHKAEAHGEGKTEKKSKQRKEAVREAAHELWGKNPTITIADMIFRDEINSLLEGKLYSEKYLRSWIQDLCPNRKPGRRASKKWSDLNTHFSVVP